MTPPPNLPNDSKKETKPTKVHPHTFTENNGRKGVDGYQYSHGESTNKQSHDNKGVGVYKTNKNYLPVIIIIVAIVIIAAGAFLYFNQTGREDKSVNLNPLNQSVFNKNWGPPLGGPCSYDKYQGSCKTISIIKTDASRHQIEVGGGPGYEGFEIKFKFTPKDKLNLSESTKWAENQILNNKHLLLLINSWYPGPKFLEKYKIKENATFDCKAEVITEGTCSPIGFEFNDINVGDYFECEKCPK